MTSELTDSERAFLNLPNPAVMATVAKDGRPVTVATWYLLEDDDTILLNLDAERVRLAHIRRDPRLALTVIDNDDWYTHVSLQLVTTSITDDPELTDIDALSVLYTGHAYPNRERPRVSVRAEIRSSLGWGKFS